MKMKKNILQLIILTIFLSCTKKAPELMDLAQYSLDQNQEDDAIEKLKSLRDKASVKYWNFKQGAESKDDFGPETLTCSLKRIIFFKIKIWLDYSCDFLVTSSSGYFLKGHFQDEVKYLHDE